MALLQDWEKHVQGKQADPDGGRKFWKTYLDAEKGFYEKILQGVPEKNTVEGFAAAFGVDLMTMVGFLDGINDSLKEKNPMDTLEKDTQVNLDYDLELLYKNMVEAKAQWLYTMPQWDGLLTEERRRELYKEQKQSKTVVKGEKIGRNDPCPCGRGKKYKKCCGRDL